jgi:hypothetical protein
VQVIIIMGDCVNFSQKESLVKGIYECRRVSSGSVSVRRLYFVSKRLRVWVGLGRAVLSEEVTGARSRLESVSKSAAECQALNLSLDLRGEMLVIFLRISRGCLLGLESMYGLHPRERQRAQ